MLPCSISSNSSVCGVVCVCGVCVWVVCVCVVWVCVGGVCGGGGIYMFTSASLS